MFSAKLIMGPSAAVYGLLGITLLFLPDEITSALLMQDSAALPMQLSSAGLIGLAMLNWNGRNAIYGGIYGRPILVANMVFGIIMSTTLLRGVRNGGVLAGDNAFLVGWPLVTIFSILTIGFFILMYSPPWKPKKTN